MFPLRRWRLSNTLRRDTRGMSLPSLEGGRNDPTTCCATALAMERPMTSMLQMKPMRSSVSSSSSNMKRNTSQVLTRLMMMASLGVGISLLKTTMTMRVLTNWPTEPSTERPDSSARQAVRARVQNPPSWCSSISISTRRSSVRSITSSACGARRSIQYWALRCSDSFAISPSVGSRIGLPVSVPSTRNSDSMSVSIRDKRESSASTAPAKAQFRSQPGTW